MRKIHMKMVAQFVIHLSVFIAGDVLKWHIGLLFPSLIVALKLTNFLVPLLKSHRNPKVVTVNSV